eukprot:GHVO01018632.1.p1 GENE.GHVO01018632.1~~GHVO01018632.1.p1  ORF type:complete len:102 (-),score=5.38 GHVO01018632.1:126-431(-)
MSLFEFNFNSNILQHSTDVWREKSTLAEQLEASRAEVSELKKKEKIHQQGKLNIIVIDKRKSIVSPAEMKDMRNMISSIQNTLYQSCDNGGIYLNKKPCIV